MVPNVCAFPRTLLSLKYPPQVVLLISPKGHDCYYCLDTVEQEVAVNSEILCLHILSCHNLISDKKQNLQIDE